MNMHHLARCARALVLAAALAASQGGAQTLPAGAVAVVNGKPVSLASLDDAVRQSGQADSPGLRKSLKGMLVTREVLTQQAGKLGYEARPEAAMAAKQAHDAALIALYLRDTLKPAAVSDEQVRSRYQSIIDSLGKKEYKARIVQVADDAAANSLIAQLKAGAAFEVLASRHSVAPSRARGGEIDWISFPEPVSEGHTQGLPLPLASAIASLPPGTVSAAPVAVGDARYLVKVEQARPVKAPPYEEAAPGLRKVLEAQEMERALVALTAELIRNASIAQ
jgi:parvulin-like peptidyl-prolyl isomerase